VDTLVRILQAAGFVAEVDLAARPAGEDRVAKGEELEQVLLLAEQFPARHSKALRYPRFGAPS
jgi:hypothetical protein